MLNLFYTTASWEVLNADALEKMRERVLPEVREEVASCGNRKNLIRRLAGEILLSVAVKQCWGVDRESYRVSRDRGKPKVEGLTGVYFNISHSGDYVLCVVSDAEVGVDIERRGVARMNVARRFFHPGEVACLEALRVEEQYIRFFDYWSVKESYLKFKGTGLRQPLNTFLVEFAGTSVSLWEHDRLVPVHVQACRLDERYSCYVCSCLNEPVVIQQLDLMRSC